MTTSEEFLHRIKQRPEHRHLIIEVAKQIVPQTESWDQALAYTACTILGLTQEEASEILGKERSVLSRQTTLAEPKVSDESRALQTLLEEGDRLVELYCSLEEQETAEMKALYKHFELALPEEALHRKLASEWLFRHIAEKNPEVAEFYRSWKEVQDLLERIKLFLQKRNCSPTEKLEQFFVEEEKAMKEAIEAYDHL